MKRLGYGLSIVGLAAVLSLLPGCSGGAASSSSSNNVSSATGAVDVLLSDDSTEDWATIGVKVLSITLTPQGGGSPVAIYTAASPAPMINLVQLDQLGELIGNAQIPAGTYTSATITISANPSDILLTASSDPETGFAAAAGSTISSSQIQVQGATGTAGSLTTTVNVNLVSPLVVTAGQSNQLDLEFDLSHPAFLVAHTTASGTIWAINFKGPLRHHPIARIDAFLLRDMYGKVTAISTDNTSITINRVFATRPVVSPETATASSLSRQILVDAVNGTIFFDVDAKTRTVIKDFSSVASSLNGKYVRIAARYQVDGSLVAVRIWASSSFNSLWISPEGHVLHVNTSTNVITVENEDGVGVPLTVDSNTNFYYRVPANALSDATPIGTGTAFLDAGNIVRGFKVHVAVVDPLAVPLVAQSVDIEVAKYDGTISGANSSSFVYTRIFPTSTDDYTFTENYASNFSWWFFTFPTLATSGTSGFVSTVNGAASFGGTVPPLKVVGLSPNNWNGTTWAAVATIIEPTPVPLGTVSTAWAANSTGGTFAMTVTGGTNPVTVSASSVSGSATLVYQVDRTNNIVSISPVDLTTAAGQATIASNLIAGVPVKVVGVPQADGSIKAYVLLYFTGTLPQ